MCRWLAYTGSPILLTDVLYTPAHSLIDQSLHSRLGAETTNGDGFGVGWYDAAPVPGVFRGIEPAWNDANLRELAGHVSSPLFFAHIRAAIGSAVQQTNCHPFRQLKPGGRLLNHCITRPDNTAAIRMRGFINRYVFPDGELEGPGYLISLMHDTGFEVRHEENLREHYARTLAAWCANLDAHWDEAVAEVGQGTAGVAPVHGGLAARLRPQPHRAAPGAERTASRGRDVRRAVATRLGTTPRADLWGSRTRPPVLTWAFRRLARIR